MLQLRANLPKKVRWQNVLGGLASDNDQPMPENLRKMIQAHWRQIESTIGTEFNFDFWTTCQPRRDTYKACRAVIAAAQQQAEEVMIEAIQKAYYLRAMNPSEPEMLADLAVELGLDRSRFLQDLGSSETENEFQQLLSLRDQLGVRSFPSLVLIKDTQAFKIQHDYHDFQATISEINNRLISFGV
jgi:putative protein-disulfide isomerase